MTSFRGDIFLLLCDNKQYLMHNYKAPKWVYFHILERCNCFQAISIKEQTQKYELDFLAVTFFINQGNLQNIQNQRNNIEQHVVQNNDNEQHVIQNNNNEQYVFESALKLKDIENIDLVHNNAA